MKSFNKAEFGDFQTPPSLARQVCALLHAHQITADIIVEPTCGVGAFVLAAAEAYPTAKVFGGELNAAHLSAAANSVAAAGYATRVTLRQQDFFASDWKRTLSDLPGRLLLLGNPPWVTNAAISGLNGSNLPQKQNFQGLRGLAARTGKALQDRDRPQSAATFLEHQQPDHFRQFVSHQRTTGFRGRR
jgi:methylase of polypeptide subunit release factors